MSQLAEIVGYFVAWSDDEAGYTGLRKSDGTYIGRRRPKSKRNPPHEPNPPGPRRPKAKARAPAPDIIRAILEGRRPEDLKLAAPLRGIPLTWPAAVYVSHGLRASLGNVFGPLPTEEDQIDSARGVRYRLWRCRSGSRWPKAERIRCVSSPLQSNSPGGERSGIGSPFRLTAPSALADGHPARNSSSNRRVLQPHLVRPNPEGMAPDPLGGLAEGEEPASNLLSPNTG